MGVGGGDEEEGEEEVKTTDLVVLRELCLRAPPGGEQVGSPPVGAALPNPTFCPLPSAQ